MVVASLRIPVPPSRFSLFNAFAGTFRIVLYYNSDWGGVGSNMVTKGELILHGEHKAIYR